MLRSTQDLLGGENDRERRREQLLEEAGSILEEIGGYEDDHGLKVKPKYAVKFFKNVAYKAVGGQQLQADCMFCNVNLASTGSTRLVQHLSSCLLAPKTVKEIFQKVQGNTADKRKVKVEKAALREEEADREMARIKAQKVLHRQQTIAGAFKSAEATNADLAIAKFFYSSGIPFQVAGTSHEDTYFRDMVKAIQAAPSGYVPPNRRALAGRLIDECDSLLARELEERDPNKELAAKFGMAYTQDGWDSIDHLPLINSAYVTANNGGVHIRSVDTSGKTKNAEYIAALMIEDIYKLGCDNVVVVISN